MLRSLEEIESMLRAELDEAEKQLRDTSPAHLPEARERFKQAVHRFHGVRNVWRGAEGTTLRMNRMDTPKEPECD